MSAHAIRWQSWQLAAEADERFRRWVAVLGLPMLAFIIALPFFNVSGLLEGGGTPVGERFVELIEEESDAPVAEEVEEAAPAEEEQEDPVEPEAEPVPEPETEPVAEAPQPTQAPTPVPTIDPAIAQRQAEARAAEQARQRAAEAASAFDQLSALRDSPVTGIDPAQPLTSSTIVGTPGGSGSGSGTAANPDRVAESARTRSSGIQTPGAAPTRRTQIGEGSGRRTTTRVESPVGFGDDRSQPGDGGDAPTAGRTLQEIQLVFDRNKGAITSIINRALRTDPNLRGKIVVNFTINPDGSIRDLQLVSSELGNADVERQLLTRIGLINFGAKPVPAYPVRNYPIVLL
jgi:outer membrane biosynthesis protein TonB